MNEHLLTQCGTNYATYTDTMPTKLEDVDKKEKSNALFNCCSNGNQNEIHNCEKSNPDEINNVDEAIEFLTIHYPTNETGLLIREVNKLRKELHVAREELAEALKWKNEDPRMLREQCRVADVAFNHLNENYKEQSRQLTKANQKCQLVDELVVALELAQWKHRRQWATIDDDPNTMKTPYDQVLSKAAKTL